MKALINYEIADAFYNATGLDVIPLKPYSKLDLPVSAHADMLFCLLDKTIFCYEDYVKENNIYNTLKDSGLNVIFVSNECKKNYPYDISLNVLVMGKTLFCNIKHTAVEIVDYANNNGYKIVNIKQGYSACSTLVVDENNAITSDTGVASAIEKEGKKALLVDNSDIILKGYNCGFIGGASGVHGKKICIFGEPDYLSCKNKIEEIINDCNKTIFSILAGRVYDFGGFKII